MSNSRNIEDFKAVAYAEATSAYRAAPAGHRGIAAKTAAFCAVPAIFGAKAAAAAADEVAALVIQSEQDAEALRVWMEL